MGMVYDLSMLLRATSGDIWSLCNLQDFTGGKA